MSDRQAKAAVEARKKPARVRKMSGPLVQELLDRLRAGETLTAICADKRFPTHRNLLRWRSELPALDQAITAARQIQAETLLDSALEDAETAIDKDSAIAARVRGEIKLKVAEKLNPKRFGRQANVDQATVSVTINTNLDVKDGAAAQDGTLTISLMDQGKKSEE